ncbi:MAG: hypothetical protein O6952_09155, partial [Planctomycetota bacterium]|nr:hypothetical protein [Planctomycetota bacterium]
MMSSRFFPESRLTRRDGWQASILIGLLSIASGCMAPSSPSSILEDEDFRKITRGTVELRLGVLPPTLEKQDLEGDDVSELIFDTEVLRQTLVKEMRAASPFSGGVVPMGEEQKENYLKPGFDPGLLPADVYLRVRLKKYRSRYKGHNAAFYLLNLPFFMWNPVLGIWPISFAIADETFEGKLSAEVHLTSLYSNGIIMRKVYKDIEYTAWLNEYRDTTWERVSEELREHVWRKLTVAILKDMHGEFLSRTQAGSLEEVLGNIHRRQQWDGLRPKEDDAVHYSYILGVGDYLRPDITSHQFVENDARAIRDHLKYQTGGGKRIVHDYIGRTAGSAASRDYDSGALSTLRDLTERVTERDTLFVYIGGKGAVIKTEEGTKAYFLLYDSVLTHDRIAQTSLPVERLRDFLGRTKAGKLVVIMDLRDIEYREQTQVGGGGRRGGDGNPTDFYARIFPEGQSLSNGRVLLASASPGQRAYESGD